MNTTYEVDGVFRVIQFTMIRSMMQFNQMTISSSKYLVIYLNKFEWLIKIKLLGNRKSWFRKYLILMWEIA